MSSSVTPQYLLEGAVYALEQCGLLLRDANILYRIGSYANTVVLAAFAREELGRYKILSDMRNEALGGKIFTLKDIKTCCNDHVIRQRAGTLIMSSVTDGDSDLGRVLQKVSEASPGTTQQQEALEEWWKIDRSQREHASSYRHKDRMAALYVYPESGNQWNRPADTSCCFAQEFLEGAVNDYAMQYGHGYITSPEPFLKNNNPELYSALEKWSDRPELQRPEYPHDDMGS